MSSDPTFSKASLERLQNSLATVDLIHRPSRSRSDYTELLLKKLKNIRLTMDGDKRHPRPHIHIDYGKEKHAATFAIDDGTRLAGSVSTKYDRAIGDWISENRTALQEVWRLVRLGGDYSPFVQELMASDF